MVNSILLRNAGTWIGYCSLTKIECSNTVEAVTYECDSLDRPALHFGKIKRVAVDGMYIAEKLYNFALTFPISCSRGIKHIAEKLYGSIFFKSNGNQGSGHHPHVSELFARHVITAASMVLGSKVNLPLFDGEPDQKAKQMMLWGDEADFFLSEGRVPRRWYAECKALIYSLNFISDAALLRHQYGIKLNRSSLMQKERSDTGEFKQLPLGSHDS